MERIKNLFRVLMCAALSVFTAYLIAVWVTTELTDSLEEQGNRVASAANGSFQLPKTCTGSCGNSINQVVEKAVKDALDEHKRQNHSLGMRMLGHFLTVIVLLGLIFFADGMEIAYSLLRYKDQEQFGDSTARILQQMHLMETRFYEAREWLVTILIVGITLMMDFKEVYSPFGYDPNHPVPIQPFSILPIFPSIPAGKLYSFLFATLPVLWIAQGPSKKIALRQPQKMLDSAVLIWLLVRGIGRFLEFFALNHPIKLVSWVITKIDRVRVDADGTKGTGKDASCDASKYRALGTGQDSKSRPSDHAYFIASLQRYGYALHNISVRIDIGKDGGCKVHHRLLYYVIERSGSVFATKLTLDEPCKDFREIKLKAYCMALIQDPDTRECQDAILDELDTLASMATEQEPDIELLECNLRLSNTKDESVPKRQNYKIDTHGSISSSVEAYAILAEFESEWHDGAFKVPKSAADCVKPEMGDFFFYGVDCPCYRYALTVETEANFGFELSEIRAEAYCGQNPHWGERDRLQNSLGFDPEFSHALHCNLHCPFPGTQYRFQWRYAPRESSGPPPGPTEKASDRLNESSPQNVEDKPGAAAST